MRPFPVPLGVVVNFGLHLYIARSPEDRCVRNRNEENLKES